MQQVAKLCATERLYWTLGFCAILSLGLYLLRQYHINQDDPNVVELPLWVVTLPLLYAVYLLIFYQQDSQYTIDTERTRLEMSGGQTMKEFLQTRAAEEGRIQGLETGVMNAAIISGSSLFGPFWRA